MSFFPNPIVAAGTTTARSLPQRFGDVFNVKDFGATGAFGQDATASVQAAVNAAVATGRGSVYFPAGQYRLGAITIGPGISIYGDGQGVSQLFARDSGQSIFTYTATTATVTNITIRNLSFESNNTGTGIYISGTNAAIRIIYIRISDCFFGLLNKAVHLRFSAVIWLTNITTQGCADAYYFDTCGDVNMTSSNAQNASGYGYTFVHSEPTRGPSSEGVRLVNCSTNGQKAIYADEIHWAQAIGCSFTSGFPAGAPVAPTEDAMVDLINCANWRFEGTDISFAGAIAMVTGFYGRGLKTDSLCERIQLTGCFFALNTVAAVLDGRWNTATGCVFSPNGTRDLEVRGKYSTVTGNTCASAITPNILEIAGADYNSFVGNVCNGGLTVVGANSISGNNITSHPNT
jgi:hypothetical protein